MNEDFNDYDEMQKNSSTVLSLTNLLMKIQQFKFPSHLVPTNRDIYCVMYDFEDRGSVGIHPCRG